MSSSKFLINKFTGTIAQNFVSDVDFSISGLFVVDVPDGVQLITPSSYANLKTQKEAGFIDLYPDFPNVVYNELDTDASVDTTVAYKAHSGNHEWLIPATNGSLTTTATTLSGSPYQYVAFWSVYEISWSQGDANIQIATYVDHVPSDLTVEVSFDGGSNWETATYDVATLPTITGTSLKFRITNTGSSDLYLGYYALVWRS